MKTQVLIVAFFFCGLSCTEKRESHHVAAIPQDSLSQEAEVIIKEKAVFFRDSLLDCTARFLAGMDQNMESAYTRYQEETYWKEYRNNADKNWAKLERERLEPMRLWERDSISRFVQDSLVMFYPFSGPDYLHAAMLYPDCRKYIFCALEPIQEMPDITEMDSQEQMNFLQSIERSLRDIYGKSYFITTHMMDDLKKDKTGGVLPLFYVFLVRTAHEILEADPVAIDTSGVLHDTLTAAAKGNWVKGTRIRFRNTGSDTLRELYYFSADVSDKGLKNKPGLLKYLDAQGEVNTMIKSASYMLHYSTFSALRNKILAISRTIFQDDTGIPYKYFKSDKQWLCQLYGEYTKPVKDFGDYVFQKDLDSLYASGYPVHALPFHLGYHWNDKKQTQQIYIRRK